MSGGGLTPGDPVRNPWLVADYPPSEPGTPRPSRALVEKSGLDRTAVLLAEDNQADVVMIEEAIARYGLRIDLHVVEDGAKAIEFIERADNDPEAPCPQLLLLDLNLPKRSGREVLQRLRESAKCKGIPVLIITSSNSEKDRREVGRLGIEGYFCKPADYDEFLKVGEVLKALIEERKV